MRPMVVVPIIWVMLGGFISLYAFAEGNDQFTGLIHTGEDGTPYIQSFDNISGFTLENTTLSQKPTTGATNTTTLTELTESGTLTYILTFIDNTFKVISLQIELPAAPVAVEFLVNLFFMALDMAFIVDIVFFFRGVQ